MDSTSIAGMIRNDLVEAIANLIPKVDAMVSEQATFLAADNRFSSLAPELAILQAYTTASRARSLTSDETAAWRKVSEWLTDAETVRTQYQLYSHMEAELEAKRGEAARDWLHSTSLTGYSGIVDTPLVDRFGLIVPSATWALAWQHLASSTEGTTIALPNLGRSYPQGIAVALTLSEVDADAKMDDETEVIDDICERIGGKHQGLRGKLDGYLSEVGKAERRIIERVLPAGQHAEGRIGGTDHGGTQEESGQGSDRLSAARAANKWMRDVLDHPQIASIDLEGVTDGRSMNQRLLGLESIVKRMFEFEGVVKEFQGT